MEFRLQREEEIGPRLRSLGIGNRDVKLVVLTHLHADHDGGVAHFPDTEILVSRGEFVTAAGWMGRLRGYLPNRWPTGFDPRPLHLANERFGPFAASRRLTGAGDVIAVATPGHTRNHVSVVVEDGATTYFLAGDASYTQALMLAGRIDGVSIDDDVAASTLVAIGQFAGSRSTVYLPTHDPDSAARLAGRACVPSSSPSIGRGAARQTGSNAAAGPTDAR